MPLVVDVIVPVPLPSRLTVRVNWRRLNTALTVVAALTVTVQVLLCDPLVAVMVAVPAPTAVT